MSSEVSCVRLGLAREGGISLEEATYPPLCAPPPPLFLPLAMQVLHTLSTLEKQLFPLTGDWAH